MHIISCYECNKLLSVEEWQMHDHSQQDADPINHPTHYTQGGIQPIDFIVANDMGFLAGNVVKYLTRYKHKNGVEDLKKAKAYLERLIKLEEGKESE